MPLLWTSALCFKARMDLLACMLHCLYASLPVYNGIFRFASGVTPAYYLATSIVTKLCWSTYCVHKHWWGSNLGCSMSLPLSVTQDWCSTKWAKLAQLRGIHSNWTSYKRDQCICKRKQEGISVWTCWGEVSLYGEEDRPGLGNPCVMGAGRGWGCPNGGGQVSKDWACPGTMARARDPCMVWEAAGAWGSLYGEEGSRGRALYRGHLPPGHDRKHYCTFFSLPAKKNHSVGKIANIFSYFHH